MRFSAISELLLTRSRFSVLAITIASERAARREDVKGSGTFLPALIDELGYFTLESIAAAKIEIVA